MPKQPGGVKRGYTSPFRARQAEQTRLAVLAAAARLFVEKGYVATTVDDVAHAAGVSRATVFTSVGSKRELMKEARDVSLVGDDRPVAMPQREWVHALRSAPAAEQAIAIYAEAMRTIHGRAAALERAIAAGADADPYLRQLRDVSHEQRYFGCRLIGEALAMKGPLRDRIDAAAVADVLFALASPDVYHLLTVVRAWSPARYEAWLREALKEQLLPASP